MGCLICRTKKWFITCRECGTELCLDCGRKIGEGIKGFMSGPKCPGCGKRNWRKRGMFE